MIIFTNHELLCRNTRQSNIFFEISSKNIIKRRYHFPMQLCFLCHLTSVLQHFVKYSMCHVYFQYANAISLMTKYKIFKFSGYAFFFFKPTRTPYTCKLRDRSWWDLPYCRVFIYEYSLLLCSRQGTSNYAFTPYHLNDMICEIKLVVSSNPFNKSSKLTEPRPSYIVLDFYLRLDLYYTMCVKDN